MKNKLLLLTLLLCFCQLAKAQAQDSIFYRHSLGIVASPVLEHLFSSNRELPVGLIYRYHLKANSVVRLSMIGSYSSSNFTSTLQSPEEHDKHYSNSIQFMAGHEWQVPIHKLWILYYGAEAGAFLKKVEQDKFYFVQTDVGDAKHITTVTDETVGAKLRPFLGVTLKLSPKFYVSTETAVVLSKHRSEFNSKETMYTMSSNETLLDVRSNGIWKVNKISYQPLSNISLQLRF